MSMKPSIDDIESRLIDAYIAARRLYNPDFHITAKHVTCLKPAAKFLHEINASPELYIDFLMDSLKSGATLFKEMVASQKALNVYSKLVHKEDIVRRIRLQNSAMRVRQHLMMGKSLAEILNNEELDIHPIIAYVVADANGDVELASKFKDEALSIVNKDSKYWDILQEILNASNSR